MWYCLVWLHPRLQLGNKVPPATRWGLVEAAHPAKEVWLAVMWDKIIIVV
ncbi:MAG: hypothetical protein Q7T83_08055 [Thermodesulfovibrionales bacterium]|nr:hypothetical protein [Thermodesulfovibrionales bacterium]